MSRPQEFNTDAAIDAAMGVFWDRGVHRTSVDDLLNASGLSRSSLYNTFGGKQAFFEKAVLRYVDNQVAGFQRVLDAKTLNAGLKKLFQSVVVDNHGGKGCLLVNCAGSLMQDDSMEQALLHNGFARMFAVLEGRIKLAQEMGEVPSTITPADAAVMVCAMISGLRIFGKAGMEKARLKRVADLAVKHLMLQIT